MAGFRCYNSLVIQTWEPEMEFRRLILASALLSVALPLPVLAAQPPSNLETSSHTKADTNPAVRDFDFLMGRWTVKHRKLQQRLVNSNDWLEFDGTLFAQKLMDGYSNVDDNVFFVPGGTYRGVGLRSFDAKTQQWSIWWLDSRMPLGPLDPPVRGRFKDGVGTFYAEDSQDGKPVRVRFTWSGITPTTAHWEQAMSTDGGKTWEVNWVMDFKRAP
jgi:hypothetical protein